MKINLSHLMHEAWKLHRKGIASFATALRLAWANEKLNQLIREHEGIQEESHSWAGWQALGYCVKHGASAAYSVMIADPGTRTGYRKKSYFTRSQVQPIEA